MDPSDEKEHDSLRAKTLGGRLKILVVRSEMKGREKREIAMEQRVTHIRFRKLEVLIHTIIAAHKTVMKMRLWFRVR